MLLPQLLFLGAIVVNSKHTHTLPRTTVRRKTTLQVFHYYENMRLLHKIHVHIDKKKFNLRVYEQRDQNVHLITVSDYGK